MALNQTADKRVQRGFPNLAIARAIKVITVLDPVSGNDVEVELYLHENGGIFGIDASFLTSSDVGERSDPEDDDSDMILPDVFADLSSRNKKAPRVQLLAEDLMEQVYDHNEPIYSYRRMHA